MPNEPNQASPADLASPLAEKSAPSAEQTSPPRRKRKRPSVKLICFLLLCVFPAYCFGAVALHFLCYWLEIRTDTNGAVSPATAAPFEQPVRDALKPALTQKYGLKDFDVKYTRPGWFIGERRICSAGWNPAGTIRIKVVTADGKRYFEIAEDVARIKRETPGLPQCPFVLEFDQPLGDLKTAEDWRNAFDFHNDSGFVIIVIPDPVRGYDGRIEWHTDDFTPTVDPDAKEEAQE